MATTPVDDFDMPDLTDEMLMEFRPQTELAHTDLHMGTAHIKPVSKPKAKPVEIVEIKPSVKTNTKPSITLEYALTGLLEIEVSTVTEDNSIKPFSNFTLKPHDYQITAYNALKDKHRTVLQLPCGMGKTLISIMLSSHYDKVVFISPLKAFCDQNLKRFKEQLGGEYECNLVDSEGIRDSDALADILADTRQKQAFFVTYKSIDVVMKLYDMGLLDKANTLFIIDEFHNIPFDDAFTYDSEDEDYLDDDIESMEDDDISMENEEKEKHSDSEMESDSFCDDGDEREMDYYCLDSCKRLKQNFEEESFEA